MFSVAEDSHDPLEQPASMAETGEHDPTRDVEMFRYRRGDDVRIYHLRVVPGGTELWRATEQSGQPPSAVKEDDFNDPDVAAQYLKEVERCLIAGGWRLVSEFKL